MTAAIQDPYGWHFLAAHGLNLTAVLDTTTLPQAIQTTLSQHHLEPTKYKRIILLGNGGGTFWQTLQKQGRQTTNLFDDYSIELAEQWISHYVKEEAVRLYPQTDILVPLQQLGMLANWCHPSPLGSSISPQYGPWFAYRAAFVTTAELPLKQEASQPSPCHTCVDKPCISACPVNAVQSVDRFQMSLCLPHRLAENSPCQDRCFARMACPIATEHRYPLTQIQHHYRSGRKDLQKYLA